jgi:hypothetical protein
MVIVGARCLCMPPGSGSAASCAPAIARAERARIAPGSAAQQAFGIEEHGNLACDDQRWSFFEVSVLTIDSESEAVYTAGAVLAAA